MSISDVAIDAVDQLLGSGEWQLNLQTFIDCNCLVFCDTAADGGHHHGQHDVFREFVKLKEAIVGGALSSLGCAEDDFAAALEVRVKGGDSRAVKLLDTLFYLDDFAAFARFMQQRNRELTQHGPLGPAPATPSATASTGAGGVGAGAGAGPTAAADGFDSDARDAGLPMFVWDKEWEPLLAVARDVAAAAKRGSAATDDDRALLPWAESMLEMEKQRVAAADVTSPYVMNLEAVLRGQRSAVDARLRARLSGAPAPAPVPPAPTPAPTPSSASAPTSAPATSPASGSPGRSGGYTERKTEPGDDGDNTSVAVTMATAHLQQRVEAEKAEREARERQVAELQARLQEAEREKQAAKDAAAAAEKEKEAATAAAAAANAVKRTDIDTGMDALSLEEAAQRQRRREWIMSRGMGERSPAPAPAYDATAAGGWDYGDDGSGGGGYDYTAAAAAPAAGGGGDGWGSRGYAAAPAPASTGAYQQAAWESNPAEWTRCFDEAQGHYFWVNNTTGESMWEEQPVAEE